MPGTHTRRSVKWRNTARRVPAHPQKSGNRAVLRPAGPANQLRRNVRSCDGAHTVRHREESRSTERKLTPCVEGVMRNRKIFQVALTLMLAVAVAYPLLFWGTATLSDTRGINVDKRDPIYSDWARGKRESLLW